MFLDHIPMKWECEGLPYGDEIDYLTLNVVLYEAFSIIDDFSIHCETMLGVDIGFHAEENEAKYGAMQLKEAMIQYYHRKADGYIQPYIEINYIIDAPDDFHPEQPRKNFYKMFVTLLSYTEYLRINNYDFGHKPQYPFELFTVGIDGPIRRFFEYEDHQYTRHYRPDFIKMNLGILRRFLEKYLLINLRKYLDWEYNDASLKMKLLIGDGVGVMDFKERVRKVISTYNAETISDKILGKYELVYKLSFEMTKMDIPANSTLCGFEKKAFVPRANFIAYARKRA